MCSILSSCHMVNYRTCQTRPPAVFTQIYAAAPSCKQICLAFYLKMGSSVQFQCCALPDNISNVTLTGLHFNQMYMYTCMRIFHTIVDMSKYIGRHCYESSSSSLGVVSRGWATASTCHIQDVTRPTTVLRLNHE